MLCFCKILTGNWFKALFPPQIAFTTSSEVPSEGWRAGRSVGSTGPPQNTASLSESLRWLWWERAWEIPQQREVFKLQTPRCRASIYSFCFHITLGGSSSTNLGWRDEKCWECSMFSHCWFLLPSGSDFHNQWIQQLLCVSLAQSRSKYGFQFINSINNFLKLQINK